MKINVLVFNNYGSSYLSRKVKNLLIDKNLTFPYNRIISEEKLKEIQSVAKNVLDDFSKDNIDKNWILRFIEHCDKSDRVFYYYNTSINILEQFTILEVDTSRPWKIENYDGAEYVQYLDYVVINEDINYCDYKD